MTGKLFPEGGPHQVKSLGSDRYEMSITLPTDADGRIARECPSTECSPGYFKVRLGTGITTAQVMAYCPYCRRNAEPGDFSTREQVRYAQDLVLREAQQGLQGAIKDAFGIGASGKRKVGDGIFSMEWTFKPGALPQVRRPYEDEVRRDVDCPHCHLDQTVFGLATWCADCGQDIFMTHVAAELEVTRLMVGDVARREEMLGKRVAAKDLENCLEDAVSIFEAAIKAIVRRALADRGESPEQIQANLRRIGNSFQSVQRTREQLSSLFGYDLDHNVKWSELTASFEKRHPVAHNLGVIDRKYLERVQAEEREGREVRVTTEEVQNLLVHVQGAVESVYKGIIPNAHEAPNPRPQADS